VPRVAKSPKLPKYSGFARDSARCYRPWSMAISVEPLLSQIVVDVQYSRGIVYLDRCGSLMIKLEDALGAPFQGNVPTMNHGEVGSSAERLMFTYGPKNFQGTQTWVESPARVEQLAPVAWELVGETLEVQKHVHRVGVRFIHQWKVDDMDEGRRAMASSEFVCPSYLASVVGDASTLAWTLVVEDTRGRLRIATDINEFKVDGVLPANLVDRVPSAALVLDLDFAYPGTPPFHVNKNALKDFIRGSWQRSKIAAKSFRDRIGGKNDH
jgi:hypothetical protein